MRGFARYAIHSPNGCDEDEIENCQYYARFIGIIILNNEDYWQFSISFSSHPSGEWMAY